MEAGDRVVGRFNAGASWYPGTIEKVAEDGTVDISYDDGDREKGVQPSLVRVSKRRRAEVVR